MRGYVAPTDQRWFEFHAARGPQEVNFWRPSGRGFSAISPGEPFFFKLKAPFNAIGGFGFFARADVLPLWLAWEIYGEANGVASEEDLAARVRVNHATPSLIDRLSTIGCVSIVDPVFFGRNVWVNTPSNWSAPIVAGKTYDLEAGEGQRIWRECTERASASSVTPPAVADLPRFGQPSLVRRRLGQGSFKLAVFDAYHKACSVTREHSLPVLEAAHIRPYATGGSHDVANGLALRRDLHRLFDLGYVTIKPDYTFLVSRRLESEYHNGRTYYAYDGEKLHLPDRPSDRPDAEALEWHNDEVFKAS